MGGSPNRYLNLLHRDDAVSSILSVLSSADGSEVFNACDGQHATRGQIAKWVAQRLECKNLNLQGLARIGELTEELIHRN